MIRSAWRTVETRCEIRMLGAAAHHTREALQDALLGQRVDARERVVQNQNPRIAQDGAGDGGALFLAARRA